MTIFQSFLTIVRERRLRREEDGMSKFPNSFRKSKGAFVGVESEGDGGGVFPLTDTSNDPIKRCAETYGTSGSNP
jgi:hypothetical protein